MLWIVYGVLHSVLAGRHLKKRIEKRIRNYRLLYTLFAFVFFIAIIWYQVRITSYKLFSGNTFILIAGTTLALSGLVVMLVCIKKYFMTISGLRSLFKAEHSNELLVKGIHRYIRHPLYLGTFAFIWGLFLLMPYLSLLVANTVITAYTLIGIGFEERKLVAEFGSAYRQYQKDVPKLVPFLKLKRKH